MNNPENYTEAEQQETEPDFYGKWLSVDLAPKDGTWILGYSEKAKNYNILSRRVTRWDKKLGWGEFNSSRWPMTHFMILPAPPKAGR